MESAVPLLPLSGLLVGVRARWERGTAQAVEGSHDLGFPIGVALRDGKRQHGGFQRNARHRQVFKLGQRYGCNGEPPLLLNDHNASLMLAIWLIARKRGIAAAEHVSVGEMPAVMGRALPSLTLPVVLLGGIWSGVFSPTESAAVAALWALA